MINANAFLTILEAVVTTVEDVKVVKIVQIANKKIILKVKDQI